MSYDTIMWDMVYLCMPCRSFAGVYKIRDKIGVDGYPIPGFRGVHAFFDPKLSGFMPAEKMLFNRGLKQAGQ